MASAVPKVIKNFNLMIDGHGFAGLVDEVTLPVLSIKEEEHRGGGLDAPVGIDLGMDKLELKGSMHEHSPILFRQFGLRDGQAVSATFRGAKVDDKVVEPYIITTRGRYKDLTPGAVRAGEKTPLTFTLSLRYYRLEMNGEVLIEIDVDNMVRRVGGVDQLAEIRNAISV